MPSAAFVINRARVRDLAGFRRRCADAATAGGWDPVLLETTVTDPGLGLTRDAVAAGAEMVVAAGGDGTVRACAQALARAPVPLAIVPLGTGNLAARALGVPRGLDAALVTAFAGADRRIDLAEADGMTFTAMAGIGLDAAVVGATPQLLKERLGWPAYAAAGITHLAGRRRAFTVRLDGGEPMTRRARSVVAGNAGLLPGGFTLLPRARMDDGLLDVGILAASDPLAWARVAHRVITGSGREDAVLQRYRARRVEIRAGDDLPREVDGEIISPGRSLTVTIVPGALTVRVPAG